MAYDRIFRSGLFWPAWISSSQLVGGSITNQTVRKYLELLSFPYQFLGCANHSTNYSPLRWTQGCSPAQCILFYWGRGKHSPTPSVILLRALSWRTIECGVISLHSVRVLHMYSTRKRNCRQGTFPNRSSVLYDVKKCRRIPLPVHTNWSADGRARLQMFKLCCTWWLTLKFVQ